MRRKSSKNGEGTSCLINEHCEGKLCCNPNTNKCIKDPKGTICLEHSNPLFTGLPKPSDRSKPARPSKHKGERTCATNDDCPGVLCCHPNNKVCVRDRRGNICVDDSKLPLPEKPVKQPEESPKPQCLTEKQFQDVILRSPDRVVDRYFTSGQPCDKNLCFTEGDADMVRKKFKNASWTKDLRVCEKTEGNKKEEKPKTDSKKPKDS
ncbi:hypothetical protein EC973_006077, partial [Apophysomyces ossiformis]